MNTDIGYYIGMSITAVTGAHTFIDLNKDKWWMVVLVAIGILFYSLIFGMIGSIIQDTISKIYEKWNGKKKLQKQPLGGC